MLHNLFLAGHSKREQNVKCYGFCIGLSFSSAPISFAVSTVINLFIHALMGHLMLFTRLLHIIDTVFSEVDWSPFSFAASTFFTSHAILSSLILSILTNRSFLHSFLFYYSSVIPIFRCCIEGLVPVLHCVWLNIQISTLRRLINVAKAQFIYSMSPATKRLSSSVT